MTSAHFNRLLAVLQVLPGLEAHELCVHMDMKARGRIGGLLAGLGFILRALHSIGAHALEDRWLWGLALFAAAATMAGISFWVALLAAGLTTP